MDPVPQDFVDALVRQRDAAMNEVAHLMAQVAAQGREIAALRQEAAQRSGEAATDDTIECG